MDVKDVLECYEMRLQVEEYIIAKEAHKDGTPHIHVYLNLTKKTRVKVEHFDLVDVDVKYHGNYQTCRNSFKVQKYCMKGGDYISNMEFNMLRQALNLAEGGDVAGGFDAVCEARPDMVLTCGNRVLSNLQMIAERATQEEEKEDLRAWVDVPEAIGRWQRNRHVLWLFGPTGVGKTQYAKGLFRSPLLVRHVDQLKGLVQTHDGIVFDDFAMRHWPRESAIHICDLDNKSGINVKHGVAVIPKGMPRVFCSNDWIWPNDESGAIERRVHAVHVARVMYADAEAMDVDNKPDDDWREALKLGLTDVNDRLMGRG